MKKYLFILTILVIFKGSVFSQDTSFFLLESLEFLNQKFHLNLKKERKPVLIDFEECQFICHQYTDRNDIPVMSRLQKWYELNQVSDNKYEFILKSSTLYKGSFEVKESKGEYRFINLKFVKRDD